jgi:VanZ family protein
MFRLRGSLRFFYWLPQQNQVSCWDMSRARSFLIYWLPVGIWMCLIFTASSDKASYQHSSRILGPFLHWLFPHLSDTVINNIIYFFRKCAHLTEYAILALLLWRAMRQPIRRDSRPWDWRIARLSILIVALYAATDEFHQLFVPTRDAALHDVLIDTIGGSVGILLLWSLGRWRKQW